MLERRTLRLPSHKCSGVPQLKFMMKKLMITFLAISMCFSFTACGSKSTESNANTESSSFAETDFSADPQETSLSADSSADSSENGETVGQTLLKAFQEEMKQADPAPTAAELAQTLISNPIIEFFGESGSINEGLLTGFSNTEITGFQEGAIFAPSISTIPFIGYIFVLDENADVDAFTSTLKENANLRWNICTEAEELIVESVDHTVFFLMSPRQLGE